MTARLRPNVSSAKKKHKLIKGESVKVTGSSQAIEILLADGWELVGEAEAIIKALPLELKSKKKWWPF